MQAAIPCHYSILVLPISAKEYRKTRPSAISFLKTWNNIFCFTNFSAPEIVIHKPVDDDAKVLEMKGYLPTF